MKIENKDIFLEQLLVGEHKNFTYVIGDKETRNAVVVDPAWEVEKIMSLVESQGFDVRFIINTHAHYDHIEGNQKLASLTGAKIVMHNSSLARKDSGVRDGEKMTVGSSMDLRFIHTPGHSPESMCILVNDVALLTGDTLFIGECGRVDLPGGDAALLYESFQKISALDKNLVVCPGHDYGSKDSTTLSEQLSTNYTLAERTREDFIKFMNSP